MGRESRYLAYAFFCPAPVALVLACIILGNRPGNPPFIFSLLVTLLAVLFGCIARAEATLLQKKKPRKTTRFGPNNTPTATGKVWFFHALCIAAVLPLIAATTAVAAGTSGLAAQRDTKGESTRTRDNGDAAGAVVGMGIGLTVVHALQSISYALMYRAMFIDVREERERAAYEELQGDELNVIPSRGYHGTVY